MKGEKMRLIDADALKEKINKRLEAIELAIIFKDKSEKVETTLDEIHSFWCNAVDMIEAQPTVCQWIPCSKRLPEDYHAVNVTWVNRNPEPYYMHIKDKPFTATACYHNRNWYWYSSVIEDLIAEYGGDPLAEIDDGIEIIAWQPLPEAYAKGDEK